MAAGGAAKMKKALDYGIVALAMARYGGRAARRRRRHGFSRHRENET